MPGSIGLAYNVDQRSMKFDRYSQALFLTAALVIVLAGIKFAAAVLVPFFLGGLIAVAAQPISGILVAKGVSRSLATTATVLIALSIVAFGSFLLFVAASELTDALPALQESLVQTRHTLIETLEARGLNKMADVVMNLDYSEGLPGTLTTGIFGAASLVTRFFLILIITIFMLLEAASFDRKLRWAFGDRATERMDLEGAAGEIQRYLVLKSIICLGTGAMIGVMDWAFGLKSPIFWGIMAFVLNYIPFIGSAVAAAPAVLLAWVQLGIWPAVAIGVGYLAINLLFGNVLEPRLLGRSLGLSPLVVLMSVFVWGWLLGPIGALISVPLTQVLKIACSHSHEWQWVAVLMSHARIRQKTMPPLPTGSSDALPAVDAGAIKPSGRA